MFLESINPRIRIVAIRIIGTLLFVFSMFIASHVFLLLVYKLHQFTEGNSVNFIKGDGITVIVKTYE